jgi:hypothetical protein
MIEMPESTAETAHTSSDTATEVSQRETLDAENLTTPAALSADSLTILGSPTMNLEENDKARTEASLLEDTPVLTELALEAVSVTSNSALSEAVMVKTARNVDTVEGETEAAASRLPLERTDVLEPAEGWIRSWVPLRDGQ